MKITKQRLIQIIKEELQEIENKTTLGTGTTSASAAKKSFRQSGDTISSAEITPKERQIMNQMKDRIEQAAKELEIGSGQPYAMLQRVYKLLNSFIEDGTRQDEQ